MKKRLLALLLALAVLPSAPAAARASGDPYRGVVRGGGETSGEGTETVSVAVLQTGYGLEMWEDVARAFTAETGIGVELTANRYLEDVIAPRMEQGTYPDVVYLPTGRQAGLTERLIREEKLADLTGVLDMAAPGEAQTVGEKLLPGFTETSLTAPYGDGRTYLAPLFYAPCGLFYDAGLFEKKGWKVPETWAEMWDLGETAKKEGIYLFTYPTTGYLDTLLYALLYEAGGQAFFERATHYEAGAWDTPEAARCLGIMAKLAKYTSPLTPRQANDQDFQQNQQMVLSGRALFMPNGSWVPYEMADAPRSDGFRWGVTPLPALAAGGERYSYAWMDQCWIPKGAPNMDAAKQFVAFLYSDEACSLFIQARQGPDYSSDGAVQPVKGLAGKLGDEEMRRCYSVFEGGAKPATGSFAEVEARAGLPTAREIWLDPMNMLVAGLLTEQQWTGQIKRGSGQLREHLKE